MWSCAQSVLAVKKEPNIVAVPSDLKNPVIYDSVKRVILSQFWANSRFIGVCAASIQHVDDIEEKLEIVEHLECIRKHMTTFRRYAEEVLEIAWDSLDHSEFGCRVMTKRYGWLRESTDLVELLVGLYMFAHGVIGHAEFTGLYNCSPEIFPEYDSFARDVDRQCAMGSARLRRLLEDRPSLREHAVEIARQYGSALVETATDPSFSLSLAQLAKQGLLPPDITDRAGKRYEEVFAFLLS